MKNTYLLYIGSGFLAGIITRLTDFFPNDDLWSFSSIATLFGFWMVTVTLVIYFSSSNTKAALNVLLYLISMNFSFYFLKYALGFFIPLFHSEGFQWNLFFLYNALGVVCSVISYVLYFWHKQNMWSNILFALPIGGLLAETIGIGFYLYHNSTFLFQFLFDLLSLMALGYWFSLKTNNKWLYFSTILFVSFIGYFLIYAPFI